MKTIVAGSREKYWPSDFDYMAAINQAVTDSKFLITEVVSGMATGFDLWGIEWAKGVGLPWSEFPADWNKHGKRAGYIRNTAMAIYAKAAIVIWDGQSRGSKHMIDIARQEHKKIYVHIPGVAVTEQSGVVNYGSKTANMYGCEPCPRCSRRFRVVFAGSNKHISCDDCNFMQPITKEVPF